jgi:enamine deaminase RidA (YjgF/YER057c/UK114 family)
MMAVVIFTDVFVDDRNNNNHRRNNYYDLFTDTITYPKEGKKG